MKKKRRINKMFAWLLVLAMIFTNTDMTVVAAEAQNLGEAVANQQDSNDGDTTAQSVQEVSVSSNDVEQDSTVEEPADTESDETSQEDGQREEEAFSQTKVVGGIEIAVSAPAGVFPTGSTLQVQMITNDADVSEIEQLVAEKKDETTADDVVTEVEQSYSFDITVIDGEGMEVEPDQTKGEVSVTFKNVGAAEAQQQEEKELSVFYVSDDYTHAEEIDSSVDVEQDSAEITAEHFSIYTVVITSGSKKNTILHYYQGTSKKNSYFTIYNEEQLVRYRELLNDYVAGNVKNTDTLATILVNSDDSNPMDGITGLGQATDMTVSDLNFSAKIMDDITVESAWSPINKIPAKVTFDGAGHTITFKQLENGLSFDGTSISVLVKTNEGTVKDITVAYGDKSYTIEGEEDVEKYASVTVRVDGQKAEIGEAITGAEALAASADGENYVTLERDDDLAVYRTRLDNLYPVDETEEDNSVDMDKEYAIYYVYEDENDSISAAKLTSSQYETELNYVSVTYDLEGANTYKMIDGKLSENVMAAIRVDVKEDGSYEAQEDYEAVVKAADGFEIPTLAKNVQVTVGGQVLTLNNDFNYSYDESTKLGTLKINKEKITGPVKISVQADTLDDLPSAKIILKTRGGSLSDAMWEKTADGTYEQTIYGGGVTLPTTVASYKESKAIKFAGWYTDMSCTGSPVTNFTFAGKQNTTQTYYAKWVLAQTSDHSDSVYYEYYSNGKLEIEGYPYNGDYSGEGMVTYNKGGFGHSYNLGALSTAQKNGTSGGSSVGMVSGVGQDIFKRIGSSNIYVALICTVEDQLVDITYLFENRGTSTFTTGLYFGASADVDISTDDGSPIGYVTTDNGVSYMTMTSRPSSNRKEKQFRLYTKGASFGVDEFYSYWYGAYSGATYPNHVFSNENRQGNVSDTALAFSWYMNNIPAGGYVSKTTKMGLADLSVMNNITANLNAGEGHFEDGSTVVTVSSDQKSISVGSDNVITVKNAAGTKTINPPTRTGYKFSHWSLGSQNSVDCAGKTYTESVNLFANWVPQPDKSVTNNSSVQKVNGSNNLLVPEALANIVIHNTTEGASVETIAQGETVSEAAGYASGFSCTLEMEGADDRYLLPDNIEVTVTENKDGKETVTKLTKDTGYVYNVYDNRRKASLEIRKQFINGDVTITAVGYALPPVTATSVEVRVASSSISYGDRAVLTASAQTSKNHLASYQWYVAPYYEVELDNELSWTYENQNGIALQNGTNVCEALNASGNPVTISGANKATLRISGLDVNTFTTKSGTSMNGLRFGGYHFYCVVTSTRNITGQQIVAVSDTAEFEVTRGRYAAPDGLEGSATSYQGSADGAVVIEQQENRPTLLYKKSTDSTWNTVTQEQLVAGAVTGLTAGTYQFKYQADANHEESTVTSVNVVSGRYILVTYEAAGSDNTAYRVQYKHVAYGSNVTAATAGRDEQDAEIVEPTRKGYNFLGWDPETISNITEDTTVKAVYESKVYPITLNAEGATVQGSSQMYEKYATGFYQDVECTQVLNGVSGITVPARDGYYFTGYFTEADGGTQVINADGRMAGNLAATAYLDDAVLYAHWSKKSLNFNTGSELNDPDNQAPETGSVDPEKDSVTAEVTPVTPADPEQGEETDYKVTVTNNTGKEANVIYIYADGVCKKTLTGVEFDEKNQYTFTLVPSEIEGENITFTIGYISPNKDDGTVKTPDELEKEADSQSQNQQYKVVYKDVNGSAAGGEFSGTFTEAAQTTGVRGAATTLPAAVKTGYTFGGWYLAARGTGRAITEIPADQTEAEVVVYARWIANKYSITLVTEGGEFAEGYTPADQYQHDGDNVSLPDATQITKANYKFLGWFDNEALTGDAITEVDGSMAGTKVYYAGWELLASHKVTLTKDGKNDTVYTIAGKEGYGFQQDGMTYVYDGQPYQFEVKAASAYRLKAVKVNGKPVTGQDGVYTITAVTDDIVITVVTEQLVSTEEDSEEKAVATIILADGTVGYFDSLASAISYAATYGTNSIIKLQKDLSNEEIDAVRGKAYTIDLNGHTLSDSSLLIEDRAEVVLMDSEKGEANTSVLEVENRGTFTNGITLAEVLNLGICTNQGTVQFMVQQDSESYDKSKFVNNGTIGTAQLESGYFVENVLEQAPQGLSGYHTIMNGNEYYVDFKDAVEIANQADQDVTIEILSTVDNRDQEILIDNEKNHTITIDLNGNNISGGTLVTKGDTKLVNSKGSNTAISENTAEIRNEGNLTIGGFVKAGGNIQNEKQGTVTVDANGSVSGSVVNKGSFENNGTVSGVFENHGSANNNGSMNNVSQKEGDFQNKGTVGSEFTLAGGSYNPSAEAQPQIPTGAVAKSNTKPGTYYGTLQDAFDDANDSTITGAEGQEKPFEITILDDITDEKMGSNPAVLQPDSQVNINLNNHQVGSADSKGQLTIGGGQTGSEGSQVSIKNEPENGEAPASDKGTINASVQVKDNGQVETGSNTSLKKVENAGTFTVDEESKVGNLTQTSGITQNNGTVDNLTQNGGTTQNAGTIDNLIQNGGNTQNTDKGTIDNLIQNGGNTENAGIITKADITNGGYSGEKPGTLNGETPEDETVGKSVKVTLPAAEGEEEKILYFVSLKDALDYADSQDKSPVQMELLKDIEDEQITTSDKEQPGPQIALDLAGHDIKDSSTMNVGQNTNLTVKDTKADGAHGSIGASVTNSGNLTLEETVSATGKVTNTESGQITNKGTITGAVDNSGTFRNEGTVSGGVSQKDGQYTNGGNATTGKITQTGGATINENANGGVESVDLEKGSYRGTDPDNGITGGVAKIGDTVYGDLESAVSDANQSTEDVTIDLIKDVTLPQSPVLVIDNANGKNVELDLKGNTLAGGTIQIGDESEGTGSSEGTVTIKDSGKEDGSKGKVSSAVDVSKTGTLDVAAGTTITGSIKNNGTTNNDGKITGDIQNNGTTNNNGAITGTVEQKNGTFTNGENGTVTNLRQTGGLTRNENTEGGIDSSVISGGEYQGTPAQDTDNKGAKVAAIKKNADGTTTTIYYPSLEEALKNATENTTLKLLDDVTDGDIVIAKPGITIDLNGKQIQSPATVTVTEGVTGTKFTDSSEGATGSVTAPVTNQGELTVDEKTSVSNVTNAEKGSLQNKGQIGQITNAGTVDNQGQVTTITNTGKVENQGTVETVDMQGGSYEGTQPEKLENAVASIGDKIYSCLEDAIKDANKAAQDTTIKIIGDATLPEEGATVGNENGKNITLDVNGKNVSGGQLTVQTPGTAKITDSEGTGSWNADVKVDQNASLEVSENTSLSGNLNNNGSIDNKGTITGSVTNDENGIFRNEDEGIIAGKVDNIGFMTNQGNIDNDVLNHGNGSLNNVGNINGQLENKDQARTDNSGQITQVKQESGQVDNSLGGKINDYLQNGGTFINEKNGQIGTLTQNGGTTENAGTITDAAVSDLKNYTGKLPENGLTKAGASLTYTDADGNVKTEHYESLEKALEAAASKNPKDDEEITVIPVKTPVTVNGEVTIPKNTTVELPKGSKLEITENGSLNNQGNLKVDEGAQVDVKTGGKIAGDGDVTNNGSLTNNGTITNVTNNENGNLHNNGTISKVEQEGGTFTNSSAGKVEDLTQSGGETHNEGAITDLTQNGGTIENDGTINKAEQKDGTFTNNTTGNVEDLTQSGGETHNEGAITDLTQNGGTTENDGTINKAEQKDGTFTNNTTGKVEDLTQNGGETHNEGTITDLTQNGGTTENDGTINKAEQKDGTFTNNTTGKVEDLTQSGGTTENDGTINKAEQKDGTFTNSTAGKVENLTQSGGATENGGTINKAEQKEGTFTNSTTGKVEDLTQSGGTTENDGTINKAEQKDGTFTNSTTGKVEDLTQNGGETHNEGTISDLTQIGGKTENEGTINKAEQKDGTFTNNTTGKVEDLTQSGGETENGGTINKAEQKDGTFTNNTTGKVEDLTQIGGKTENAGTITKADVTDLKDYNGTLPEEGLKQAAASLTYTDKNGNVKTEHYESLEKALEAAASKNLKDGEKITVTPVKTPVTVNGEVTIPKNTTVELPKGSKLEVTESGSLNNQGNLKVDAGAQVDVKTGGKITGDGDVTNNGSLTNNGTITNVSNNENGKLQNNGTISKVEQEGGTFTNSSTGKVENLTQNGGTTENDGTINKAEQKDGTFTNNTTGKVEDLTQIGGKTENTGTITKAEVSNLKDYTGTLPEGGLAQAGVSITYPDENGNVKTEHYESLKDALEAAASKNLKDGEEITVTPVKTPVTVDSSVTIPKNTTVELPKDTKLEITDGGSLNNQGSLKVDEGAKVDVKPNGSLTNEGTLTNKGSLANAGTVENTGKVENTGSLTNEGTVDNVGTVENTGTLENNGTLENKGTLENNGSVENAGTLTNKGANSTISGDGNLTNSEEGSLTNEGKITDSLVNKGEVTNSGELQDVTNTGNLTNSENGTITNATNKESGSFENDGTVSGKLENKDNATTQNKGTIAKAEVSNLKDYTGTLPEGGLAQAGVSITYPDENGNVKTEHYESLKDALEAAASKNLKDGEEITVTPVKTPVTVDSAVTIPKNTTVELPKDTKLEITDGGSLNNQGSLKVDEGAKVDVKLNGSLTNEGSLTNKGSLTNAGTVENTGSLENAGSLANAGAVENTGKVENTGSLTNEGTVDNVGTVENTGTLENNGALENKGTLENNGSVENAGTLTNKGANSTISGDGSLTNSEEGSLTNEGKITDSLVNKGEVTNSGELQDVTNTGNLTNSENGTITNVTNEDSGNFENDGTVSGKLENKDNATTQNKGTIAKAEVSNLKDYTGTLPEGGLAQAGVSITYPDENGNVKTEHYESLKDALEAAASKNLKDGEEITVTPVKNPVTVDSAVTIPKNTTVELPKDTQLEIKDGGSLNNQGSLKVDEGAKVDVKPNGSLTNEGSLMNKGSLTNAGTVDNNGKLTNDGQVANSGKLVNGQEGTIANAGDISSKQPGSMLNNGAVDNKNGTINGAAGANGSTVNNGSISGGAITGPLENSETGSILDSNKISGEIVNKGTVELSKTADISDAQINNMPGSSFVDKRKATVNNNGTANTTPEEDINQQDALPLSTNTGKKYRSVKKSTEESEEEYVQDEVSDAQQEETEQIEDNDSGSSDTEIVEEPKQHEKSEQEEVTETKSHLHHYGWIAGIVFGAFFFFFIIIILKRRKDDDEEENQEQ